MEKLVITVGITGSRITRKQTPYIPILPEEIARSGIEAWKEGASVLHIHVRDPKTELGTQDSSIFKEVVDRIRGETDALLCLTTSGIPGRNLPIAERLQPLAFQPEFVSFDAGSLNMGESVFLNPPEFLDALARETLAKGIKPELEAFDVGMVYTCLRYLEEGLLKAAASLPVCPGHPRRDAGDTQVAPLSHGDHSFRFHMVRHRSRIGSTSHGCDGDGHGWPCPGWIRR